MFLLRQFILLGIRLYQTAGPFLRAIFGVQGHCLFYPSCSAYMGQGINAFGILRGTQLGVKRILRCHPWGVRKLWKEI